MREVAIGSLIFIISCVSLFLLLSILEHQVWFGTAGRTVLLFFFLIFVLCSSILLIIRPLLIFFNSTNKLKNKDVAKEISEFFPEIEDRLINVLELGKQNSSDSELINAAIEKKTAGFKTLEFSKAVDFGTLKKYLIGFGAMILCLLLVSFINPAIISDSPKRIVNFGKEYEKASPFDFNVLNKDLTAFKGEDFDFIFRIEGNALPDKVVVSIDDQTMLPEINEEGNYSYSFEKIQSDKEVVIEANGFSSKKYEINTIQRPALLSMQIEIAEPSYTGGKRKNISNTGDFTIPEGSSVTWNIHTLSTEQAHLLLSDTSELKRVKEDDFSISKRIKESGHYELYLKNKYSLNKSELSYSIEVIKDQYPEINAQFFPDSLSFQYISLAGSIEDDYGFSELSLHYKKPNENSFNKIVLEINPNNESQSFYTTWQLDSLHLKNGDKIEAFIAVSDNDQVNGAKTSKSDTFIFEFPTDNQADELIEEKSEKVKEKLQSAQYKAQEISERLSEIEDRLKTKQTFDWQEKKQIEDLLKDRETLNKNLNTLEQKNNELQNTINKLQNQSPELKAKKEKFQELMEQLMDEETKKLYDKLKELMRENAPKDQIREQLQALQQNEQNLERNMERALELFKRLKMESTLEQSLQKLDSLSNDQDKVADQENTEQQQSEQQNINEEFEEFREQMEEVMEMNQELERPEALEDFEYEERQIAKELNEIEEMLNENSQEKKDSSQKDPSEDNDTNSRESESKKSEKNENQPSEGGKNDGEEEPNNQNSPNEPQKNQQQQKGLKEKQKNAAQKMKNLSQKLSKMQGGMQMEMMQANLDQLRDILDNLLKLSFSQEELMIEMRKVNQSDPRFLELSQNQLKLKDDAAVIQDSLLSLAKKVVQISSFVTREVDEINRNIDKTVSLLKDRNRGKAISSQQFAMTSINNLALLLDNTMQQMQMSMSEAMGNSSGNKESSEGLPDMQELQKQLGDKIGDLKESGKSGRELSEELAKLAAEQEAIRQKMETLKELEDGRPGGGKAGDELNKAIEMMEQNEIDLVNKRLSEQLLMRQKQITTRLLEADKAKREQETEEEREAESPSVISREIPPEFEDYLKQKKKEIELLKTIPLELSPFYKKEVNDYFRRISNNK